MLARKQQYNVAVAGATGAVGQEILEILEQRDFPVAELRPLASERSKDKTVSWREADVPVQVLSKDSFAGIDIALFSAGAARSVEFAGHAVTAGAVVVDNSSAFRMQDNVPLVVPEVNGHALQQHSGIIANPNCSTIQMVLALKPLHDAATIRRIVVSTYQAVSGSGSAAIEELFNQSGQVLNLEQVEPAVYPHQIAFNCLPQIDVFDAGDSTREEWKLLWETQKILEDNTIGVSATCVRVPVFRCHAESVNVEFESPLAVNEARALMSDMDGVIVFDDPKKQLYPTPAELGGTDGVYVGRVREDPTLESGLNMWIVSDNLRKGAALNAIQIAERLILDARLNGK